MVRTSISALLLLCFAPGCIGVSVGTDDEKFIEYRGLGTAYAAMPGFDDYDGKIIRLGLFRRSSAGFELVSAEVWPLAKVGVGVAGARVRVLPFEVGAGILAYHPEPKRRVVDPGRDPVEPRRPRVHVRDIETPDSQPVEAEAVEIGPVEDPHGEQKGTGKK
jgi:hypothetical protein